MDIFVYKGWICEIWQEQGEWYFQCCNDAQQGPAAGPIGSQHQARFGARRWVTRFTTLGRHP